MLPMAVALYFSGRVTKSQGKEGAILGVVRAIQSTGNLRYSRRCRIRCKRDHSITNNVMQQKGSFSMPGKRK